MARLPRLLLVEDNPADALMVLPELRRYYDVEWAQSVDDGLQLLDGSGCDAIILDLGGTGSLGPRGVSRFRTAHPTTEVIVWSGLELELLLACYDHGASIVIPKPSGVSHLVCAVEASQRSWSEPSLDATFSRLMALQEEAGAA